MTPQDTISEQIERIKSWSGTPRELIDYVGDIWEYRSPTDWIVRNGRDSFNKKTYKVDFSTWGWSGNEEIVGALEGTWFWYMFWHNSRRGGHYQMQVNPDMIDHIMPLGWGEIKR